jgi:acetoacetyl-CoA synthetase
MPVRAGEIQSRCLGVQMEAIHEDGRIAAPGEIGDLVITAPMPSMPVFLWNDPGGERYRETYFETPGVWRHGDWVTIEPSGGVIVHGRSDATINRMGVRMGSAEIYEIVEKLPEVREALVVGIERRDGDYFMPLFVALEHGVDLNEDLSAKIREALRTGLSPRHVPDDIVEIPSVPHTLTGKKLEVPVKRLLQGTPLDQAVNLGSVDDIESLRFIAEVGLPAKFETSKD